MGSDQLPFVWVFHSIRYFTGGVFSNRETAERWIAKHGLTGILTKYPLDIGVYDWAIARDLYSPVGERETPEFIGSFTTASQEHFHYSEGKLA